MLNCGFLENCEVQARGINNHSGNGNNKAGTVNFHRIDANLNVVRVTLDESHQMWNT